MRTAIFGIAAFVAAALLFLVQPMAAKMALPVLGHRLVLKPESRLRKVTAAAVVEEVVAEARVPVVHSEVSAP